MDGQPTTKSGQGKRPDRRRIAIAAALMMMGAVVIDPALLDDMNVSVQLSGKSPDGEPMDEFAQIEFMLSQSEDSSRTVSTPTVDEASLESAPSVPVEQEESRQVVSANVLMIPTESAADDTIENFEVAASGSNESVVAIAGVANTHSAHAVESPTTASPVFIPPASDVLQQPRVSHQSNISKATIRLTGTIAPIR